MAAEGSEADLYRSLVQIAVIYLHLQRRNVRGAAKVLLRLHQWLDPLPDICRGVDVASLRAGIQCLRVAIGRSPSAGTDAIDPELFKPIPPAAP
jgi:predicted metal-dependent hydrolase